MWRVLAVLLIAAPVFAQPNDVQLCPLDVRSFDDTNQCNFYGINTCTFTGLKAGVELPTSNFAPPTYVIGASIANNIQGTGDVSDLWGASFTNVFATGGTLDDGRGIYHTFQVGNNSDVNTVHHVFVNDSAAVGSTIAESYGFRYSSNATTQRSYWVQGGAEVLGHAGRARVGAAGDPTAGYDLDVQGPLLAADVYKLGPGPTSTPGATPTATAATPTPTALTPTPTPTRTAPGRLDGDIVLDGNLTFVGLAARTLKVGECQLAPCSGKGLAFEGGAAKGVGTGGSISMTGGTGANFQAGGNASVIGGPGGAHVFLTAVRGLFNIGGKIYTDGDLTSRLATSASAPGTLTAGCGTGAAIVGTNNTGSITIGTTPGNNCGFTFGNGALVNRPPCLSGFDTNGAAVFSTMKATSTTTTLVLTNYSTTTGLAVNFTAGDILTYHCFGRE